MKLSSGSLLPKQIIEALDNWAIYRIWMDILMLNPKGSGFFLNLRMLPYGIYFHGILCLRKPLSERRIWINLWGYFKQNCKVYRVVTMNFFQQEHISLQLQQGEKLQWPGFRGRGVGTITVRSNRRLYQLADPRLQRAPSLPTPVTAARVWVPRLHSKDTLQVVGTLSSHRLRGVPGSRQAHAQRFFQDPQGRGGRPLLSSHLKRLAPDWPRQP